LFYFQILMCFLRISQSFENIHTDSLIAVILHGSVNVANNTEDSDGWGWVADGKWNYGTKWLEDGMPITFSYKIEYSDKDRYLINSIWNGGGSGIYIFLSLIKIKNDSLYFIEHIAGGDRCLGGVEFDKVKLEKGS
jgi:hypothetical protein